MSAFVTQVKDSLAAFASVARNPNLRRLEAAFAASIVGHWAYAVAVSVYAFKVDGPGAVGLVWSIRMLPAAAISPFAAVLADRYRRDRVMALSDLVRALLIGAAAVAVAFRAPPALVYALAGAVAIAATPFQPASSSLRPALVETPAELTASNVVSSSIESIGFFVGPAFAGLLLAIASPSVVFAVTAGLMLVSLVLVTRIRCPAELARPHASASRAEIVAECLAGVRALAREPRLRILVGLLAATTFVVGCLEVLTVVSAIDLLGFGEPGVGYLNSGYGVGALVGAVLATSLVGVRRLSIPFIGGAVLWGLPLVVVGLRPHPVLAIVLFGVVGAGNTFVDVAGLTLVQRAVPREVLGRVFGVLQMVWLGAIGMGAAVAPYLVRALDLRGALIATGCFVPALVAVFGLRLVRIDAAATAPKARPLALLRGLRTFALLPGTVLEHLASVIYPVHFRAGDAIIREGDDGDRFYVIAEGRVDVTSGDLPIASLGPGEAFGEIALLRDVPRTATVIATGDVLVYALEQGEFLSAVTGHAPAKRAAESIVGARLASLGNERIGAPSV